MQIRSYDPKKDYERVGEFLIETYHPGDILPNWLQPRWEYMHYHSNIDEVDLGKIGLFEQGREIFGVVNIEHTERQVYFQVRPGFDDVKTLMFHYAEETFQGVSPRSGRRMRALYISEHDSVLTELADYSGYERWDDYREDMSCCPLDQSLAEASPAEGFHLISLENELDLEKINQVLWRGFDHPGDPPEEHIESRRRMKQAPNFRKDLTVVATAPDGHYVSYCGMWVVPQNQVAYVEPVATDPVYRRMGLGKAAVLESMRRAGAAGARIAWVGSGQDFYKAIGFRTTFALYPWIKFLD